MVLRDFQENKEIERAVYSWPAIIIVCLLAFAALWGVFKALRTELALKSDVNALEKKTFLSVLRVTAVKAFLSFLASRDRTLTDINNIRHMLAQLLRLHQSFDHIDMNQTILCRVANQVRRIVTAE